MRKVLTGLLMSLLLIMVLCAGSLAADRGKVGVGYQREYLPKGPVLEDSFHVASVRFRATPSISIDGMLGFGSTDTLDSWMLGADCLYNLISKENVDVYAGGGLSYLDMDTDDGLGLRGFFGAEFFFTEIPNAGINWKVGLQYYDVNDMFGTFVSVGVNYNF